MWPRRRRRPPPPPAEPCPLCGGPLLRDGSFCRGCGWERRFAESDDAYLDGVDLPGAWAARDEDDGPDAAADARRPFWIAVGVVLVVAYVLAEML